MDKIKYKLYQLLRAGKYRFQITPLEIFRFLLDTQYWSKEQILTYQINELNNLLQVAKDSSTYYKKTLKDIDLPIKSLDEFNSRVPVVEKEILKTRSDELMTKYFSSRLRHRSSGSSGDPVVIFISPLAEAFRIAGIYRALNWSNIKPYEKFVRIVGRRSTKYSGKVKDKVLKVLRPRYDINVFELNSQTIYQYFQEIREFRPSYLRGYKSAILQLAELLDAKRLHFDNFKLKLAVVSSEILLEEERQYMQKILECRVVNEYGASDAGGLAFECPNGKMHVYEEGTYVNTNKLNEVFITELHNNSMPMINYRNEDKIILTGEKCSCGRNSRVITNIEGRDVDFLVKPNGEKINANFFVYIIMELDDLGMNNSIYKWKAIQNKNHFRLMIIPKENYSSKIEDYIRKRMRDELGEEVSLEINLVENIPREKSGKLRYFLRVE